MKKADVERVIKGLECCIKQAENDVYCEDIGCPYHEPTNDRARLMCWTKLNKDALRLLQKLKVQEPIKPHESKIAIGIYGAEATEYLCGDCGCGLTINARWRTKFCPECGRKVDWA